MLCTGLKEIDFSRTNGMMVFELMHARISDTRDRIRLCFFRVKKKKVSLLSSPLRANCVSHNTIGPFDVSLLFRLRCVYKRERESSAAES